MESRRTGDSPFILLGQLVSGEVWLSVLSFVLTKYSSVMSECTYSYTCFRPILNRVQICPFIFSFIKFTGKDSNGGHTDTL